MTARLQSPVGRARAVTIFVALSWAAAVQAQTLECPSTVPAQINQIEAFAADGRAGAIEGFAQVFSPRNLRMVSAGLAMAGDAQAKPGGMVPPDELSSQLGRKMTWTLWDGRPPEPEGVLHLICEYEAGLTLNKAVGSRIRKCEMTSVLRQAGKPAAPAKGKTATSATNRAAADAETALGDTAAGRPFALKAVLTCR